MPKVKADQFEGPKKYRTGFFIFSDELRTKTMEQMKAKHGAEFKIGMVAAELGRQWKEVPEAKKTEYAAQSAKEKEVYDKAMEEWKLSDKYQEFSRSKANETQKKANKNNAKEAKAAGMPSKPMAAYMAYAVEISGEIIEKLKAEGKNAGIGGERTAIVKAKWEALSAEEKAERDVKFKAAQEKYKVDMAAWLETEAGKKFSETKNKASKKAADTKSAAKKAATAAKKEARKSSTSSQPAKKRKLSNGEAEPQPEESPAEAAESPVESESSPVESVESPDE